MATFTTKKYKDLTAHEKHIIDIKSSDARIDHHFLGDNEACLAYAQTRPIKLEFSNKKYVLVELVSVEAFTKGRGYGTELVKRIIERVSKEGKTLITFCLDDLIRFYTKLGFETIDNGSARFSFIADDKSFENETPGIPFYIEGNEGLMQEMAINGTETTHIYRFVASK